MKEVGCHRNIVNMLGCCISVEPMYLVVEYLANGDLLNYLRKKRNQVCLQIHLHLQRWRYSLTLYTLDTDFLFLKQLQKKTNGVNVLSALNAKLVKCKRKTLSSIFINMVRIPSRPKVGVAVTLQRIILRIKRTMGRDGKITSVF